MEYIDTLSDKEKIILLRTWRGQEIKGLIKRQSSKLINATKKEDTNNLPSLEGNKSVVDIEVSIQRKYQKVFIDGIRELLMKYVNRTMAMHQFMNTSQGTMNLNAFIRDLEIKAKTLNLDK